MEQLDLSMFSDDNQLLHICGENDWGYLALEVLKPILKEGVLLNREIMNGIDKNKPEVVLVGRNDYRILDILHTARDSEEGISVIHGVPIVKGNFNNGIKYLGEKETEMELPY